MRTAGAVGMRRKIAEHFRDNVFYGGLTYNSHTLACAAGLATLAVYEEDKLIDRAAQTGQLMKSLLADLAAKHPSVGAVRSIGLFGIVELDRQRIGTGSHQPGLPLEMAVWVCGSRPRSGSASDGS